MTLSIITINRNNKEGLERTIKSVINQTITDYELIVIDGASTDGSLSIIKEYESKIFHWESKPDNGIYNAMNKGIRIASGTYCFFLNSGDTLTSKNSLSKLYSSELNEDIVYGNIKLNNQPVKFPDKLTLYNLRWGTLPHPATIIKRSLFEVCGYYNEKYTIASDWEFWMKSIILKNCSYKHINQVITKIESPGVSKNCNDLEGYTILHSLFPERIIQDYDRLRELELSNYMDLNLWLKDNKILYFLFNSAYKLNRRLT